MNNKISTKQQEINPFEALLRASTFEEKKAILDQEINSVRQHEESLIKEIQQLDREAAKSPQDEELTKRLMEAIFKYKRIKNVSSGDQLSSSVHPLDQSAVKDIRQRLMAEFAPISASEALVVDQVVNAYFRSLRLSQAHLNLIQDATGGIRRWDNQVIVNLIKEIGKQANFANQQFITALEYLKSSKNPPLNVRVNAKEAYVAENQQFNKNA